MIYEYDFQQLIHPIDVKEFFANTWESQPIFIQRERADYYAKVFTLDDFDSALLSSELKASDCRLVNAGKSVPLDAYTNQYFNRKLNQVEHSVDMAKMLTLYDQGCTIILEGLQRRWPPLAQFCRNLEKHFGHRFQTNIYMTPKESQGFSKHYDDHDVFILQIFGTKHWRIFDSPYPLPTTKWGSDRIQLEKAAHLLLECKVNPGDLLYIPRGFIHEASSVDTPSLHITLGILPFMWADVLRTAIEIASARDIRLRESLPIGYHQSSGVEVQARYEELLALLSSSVEISEVYSRITERFLNNQRPILGNKFKELQIVEQLGLDSVVGTYPWMISQIRIEDSNLHLQFDNHRLQMPHYVHSAMKYIVETKQFCVGSLPNCLDEEGKLVLVRRLVKEGFLRIVES